MKKIQKIITAKRISIVIKIMLALASIVFMGLIIKINILPIKYLIPVIIIILLINVISVLIEIKLKKHKKIKVFNNIITIILIILLILVSIKIFEMNSFLDKTNDSKFEISNYYIITRKKTNYENIKELRNKDLYLLEKENNYDLIIQNINKIVKTNIKNSEDLSILIDDMLDEKVDNILLSDSDYEFICDEYEEFEDQTKILYTLKIETVLGDLNKEVDVTKESFNVYISGIDTYGAITTKSRSDVNIIMTVNPKDKKILLTSIPRDYYVKLYNTTGYKDKLTHAGVYGINTSMKTIEELLNIDINYYFRVNFNTLINIVDELGGIEINSDIAFTPWTSSTCKFSKGYQTVNGKCALAFARERKSYATGDRHRGENQQQVIEAIIKKATTSKTIITNYSKILKSLDGTFQTSLSTEEMYALIKMQIDDMTSWDIDMISLNGSDASEYTYSYGSRKLYVMIPNEETVNNATKQINKVLIGK